MKVLIICSGKPDMTWKKVYRSADFDEAYRHTIDCDIENAECERISSHGRPVYVSSHKSAMQTAEKLFTDAEISVEPLLDEVPLHSYKDTDKKLPLWRWQLMASIQRFTGNNRQPETTAQAKVRADKLLNLLEAKNQNCILVSHSIFIKILLNRFSARGYCVTRRNMSRVVPLEHIVITKWDMRCGGCAHNCLLSNPGCGWGEMRGEGRGYYRITLIFSINPSSAGANQRYPAFL